MKTFLLLSFLLSLIFIPEPACAETGVLKLQGRDSQNKILWPLLIDPQSLDQVPKDEESLAKLDELLASDRQSLAGSKRKAFYAKRVLHAMNLNLAYWLRKSATNEAATLDAQGRALRELLNFIPVALKFAANQDDKDEVYLSWGLALYRNNPQAAVKHLGKVRSLTASQKDLVSYLRLLTNLRSGDSKGLSQLEASASRLGRRAALNLALVKAQHLAGLKANYKGELLYASRLCQDLSDYERESIFQHSLHIWTKSPDFKNQWEPVPFSVSCYQTTDSFPAFMEQLALFAKGEGKLDKAMAYYQAAMAGARFEREKADLSVRYINLSRTNYLKNGKRDAYQLALIDIERRFHALPQGVRVLQLHDELVQRELAEALANQPDASRLLAARVVYNRYLESSSFSASSRKVRAQWVDLLVHNKQNEESIEVLLSLGRGTSGILRESYLKRALDLQSKILAWNPERPWLLSAMAEHNQLTRLARIIDALAPSSQKSGPIPIVRAQIADRLGLADEARLRFKEALNQTSNQDDQNRIFTTLLFYALKKSELPEIEGLVELSFTKAYQLTEALPENKTLTQLYRETLVALAEAHYKRTQWEMSRQKTDKVLPLVQDPALRLRLQYLKARSFQNQALYNDAIAVLDIIEASAHRDETWQNALLDKATLLLGQSNLEGATETYARYLTALPNAERSQEVRMGLVDLLQAQNRLADARQHLLTLLKSEGADEEDLNIWGQKLVEIHKTLIGSVDLPSDLQLIGSLKLTNKAMLAQMINLSLRKGRPQTNFATFFAEEDFSVTAVKDLVSEAAWIDAKTYATQSYLQFQERLKSSQALSEDDIRVAYDLTAKAYLKACDRPGSEFCAVALSEIAFDANRYRELGESLDTDLVKKRVLSDYLMAEQKAVLTQLEEAVLNGQAGVQWRAQVNPGNNLWRFIGIGLQKGVGALDLPGLLSKEDSLHYSQGNPP